MNDNELEQTAEWVRVFDGRSVESLRAALGVLAGLFDESTPFLNCARAINLRRMETAPRVTMAELMTDVCKKYSMTPAQMVSTVRTNAYAHPRQELMFRAFTECPHLSYPEMGKRLGGRDHTTCIHGVKAHCVRIGISYQDAITMRVLTARGRGVSLPRIGAYLRESA